MTCQCRQADHILHLSRFLLSPSTALLPCPHCLFRLPLQQLASIDREVEAAQEGGDSGRLQAVAVEQDGVQAGLIVLRAAGGQQA